MFNRMYLILYVSYEFDVGLLYNGRFNVKFQCSSLTRIDFHLDKLEKQNFV